MDNHRQLALICAMFSLIPDQLPKDGHHLEEIIADHEKLHEPLKKRARAQIIWHDAEKKQTTPYSIVYLHGFKASHPEGHPVHTRVAEQLGCNLYLSRLYGHGQITKKRLSDLTPENLIQSAVDALRIGQRLGDRVIIMGTSTGGALAAYLAASQSYAPSVAALVLYSPLVHFYGIRSLLLENSLSRKLLSLFPGKNFLIRQEDPFTPATKNIWYHSYHLNGALALGETVQQITRSNVLANVRCPAFLGYYYKNEKEHDRVVSTSAIKRMGQQLGTPPEDVLLKNFPEANSHVICSSLLSNAVQDVISATVSFLSKKTDLSKL